MPSAKNILPLLGGKYYHIFNRGISNSKIFYQERNYNYFLELLKTHIIDSVEILSYCLLPNHFHLLIRIKDSIEILGNGVELTLKKDEEVGAFISEKLRRIFISFSQAINKQENRSGNLFMRNFKRIPIEDDDYLKYLFFYIHYNPVKHGLVNEINNYAFSSYSTYLSNKQTEISRKHGLDLFGGIENYKIYHDYLHEERSELILE